jgi:ABC-type multidrug transport system fused ATPase/permease subunit
MRTSSIYKAFSLISRNDQKKLCLMTLFQTLIGCFDLLGVVLIGALGALSIQGLESKSAGTQVSRLLKILGLEHMSFQAQVAILGLIAATMLIVKTGISVYFTRKVYFYLAHKSAAVSSNLISKILSKNLTFIQKRTSQEILYIVTDGVKNIFVGMLATTSTMISDSSMLAILTIGLFLVDPFVAVISLGIFLISGLALHRQLNVKANLIGTKANILTIANNNKIIEVLNSYREITVRSRRQYYADVISGLRFQLADVSAETSFMPFFSKYVIESASVLGALGIAGYEFGTRNAVHAVAVLAVFLAASARIAPAALRIQQGILVFKNTSGSTKSTFELIEELKDVRLELNQNGAASFNYPGFVGNVSAKHVTFKYSSSDNFALEDINLQVPEGSSLAIVGPSGSGKTTLVDLILGILEPQQGQIIISGESPAVAARKWPGAMAYVPQNIPVTIGTIRENVGMGYEAKFQTDERIWESLKKAQLYDVVQNFPDHLEYLVGESGVGLSGGQLQRLGIARALFTSPKILVLDEATSALDGQTEKNLSRALNLMRGHVTTIVVAHRLSTVRLVDQLVYLDSGKICAVGKFEEVRAKVPDFDKQASLMGL